MYATPAGPLRRSSVFTTNAIGERRWTGRSRNATFRVASSLRPVRLVRLRALALSLTLFVSVGAIAQSTARSTADGVYTSEQADQGFELFVSACQNCHAPTQHAQAPFRARWSGRDLGYLFGYLRREMPQTDPGTLTNEEYAQLVAYLLRINGMKPGPLALLADSAALVSIRIDSVPSARPTNY